MRAAEVVIVGGGIIGCSIAHHLAAAGVTNVLLAERGALAGGVTGICPGGIRQQFETPADCGFARRSVQFYERINDILEPESPFHFERSGYLFLAYSDRVLAKFRGNVSLQNGLGIPSRILNPSAIHALLPRLKMEGIVGGSYCAEDGFIEDCHGITHQFALRARQRGVEIVREDVQRIAQRGGGWIVSTNAREIAAGKVVLAAGADSALLASQAGVSLPIAPEPRRLAYTTPTQSGLLAPLVIAFEKNVAAKQLTNGVLYLGWLAESADDDDLTFVERTLAAGSELLPELSELPVRRVIRGIYDNTPDRRPLLGPVEGCDGLLLAVGFSGHGFMMAPAVGEALAACVTGAATDLPLAEFRLARFSSAAAREGLQI